MRWKKSTQKLLSLVLTLAMLVSMVPAAFAEEGDADTDPVDEIVETAGPVDSTADTPVTTAGTDSLGEDEEDLTQAEPSDVGISPQADGTITTEGDLAAAVVAGGTVTLGGDIDLTSTLTIPAEATVELNLGSYTLSCRTGTVITNLGVLTITGSGTVAGSSSYAVVNHGTMTIDGATISSTDTNASCVENGWNNLSDVNGVAKLTVKSGTITGGLNAVKNDNSSELYVEGGTIRNSVQYGVMNYGTATISGGEISCTVPDDNVSTSKSYAAIYNQNSIDDPESTAQLNITGGSVNCNNHGVYNVSGNVTISEEAGITGGVYAVYSAGSVEISGNAKVSGGSSGISSTGRDAILKISGGTITGKKYYGITLGSYSHSVISGGTLISEKTGSNAYVVRLSNASVEITGGTFGSSNSNNKATVYVGSGSTANISGGKFLGAENNISTAKGVTATVTGGTFSSDVSAYVADGYQYNEDGTVTKGEVTTPDAVAEVDGTKYATLAEAVNALAEGCTLTLLANVANNDYDNVIDIKLPANATLDGNGYTLTGNITVNVNVAGGTVKNVVFDHIHNSKENTGTGYGIPNKTGNLTAIYASGLTGKAVITDCTFNAIDWEAIQITPKTGAVIEIKDNIFKNEDESVTQLRHIHIQSSGKATVTATITDNQLFNGTSNSSMGIYFLNADDSQLDFAGNYYGDVDAVSIGLYEDNKIVNANELIYPARSQAEVDTDDLALPVAVVVEDSYNAKMYSTLQAAIAAAKSGDTVTLLTDVRYDTTTVVDMSGLTLDLGGNTITVSAAANDDLNAIVFTGTNFTIKNGTFATEGNYALWIGDEAETDNVTVEDVTVGGVNVYNASNVVLKDAVISEGHKYYAVWADVNADVTIESGAYTTQGVYGLLGAYVSKDDGETPSGAITIEGGSFTVNDGKFAPTGNDNISIAGGIFNAEVPKEYCAEGFAPVKNEDGTYGVTEATANVAKVGDVEYATLQEAINAAQSGATVTLLNDITENVIIAAGQNITLDLNGHTLTGTADDEHDVIEVNGGSLTIKDSTAAAAPVVSGDYKTVTYTSGAIVAPSGKAYAVSVYGGGTLRVESGAIRAESGSAVFVGASNAGRGSAAIAGGYILGREYGIGVIMDGSVLNVTGGVVVSEDNTAIGGNGSLGQGGTIINISDGTLIGHIVTSGYIACGIYHPQDGILNITGGTIYADGGVGILMRGGELNMTGGTVTATGTASGKVGDSSIINGCYGVLLDGAAGYYDIKNTTVSISGDASVSASGGTSALMVTDKEGVTGTMAVSGGTFSSAVDEKYCAEDFEPKDNGDGTFGVVESGNYVAQVGDKQYTTLDTAIAAVQPGETITLLADVTLADNTPVKIEDKGTAENPITLDLNGHTISGSNSETGAIASSSTPGGILWISTSYVTLADSSEGEAKGCIKNEYSGSRGAFGIVVNSTKDAASHLTIKDGVKISLDTAGTTAAAIHAYTGGASYQTAAVTVEDAVVTSSGWVYEGSSQQTPLVINGGTFESKLETSKASLYNIQNATINGGTFTGGNLGYNILQRLGDGENALYTVAEDGTVTAEIVSGVPADYTAHVIDEVYPAYSKAYLKEGDLYVLQNWSMFNGKTIEVKKNASITFPDGKYFGIASGNVHTLTLALAEGVTLSGSMPLALADVTVTGAGTLGDNFFTPYTNYVVTTKDNVHSGRIAQEKLAVEVIREDGTVLQYTEFNQNSFGTLEVHAGSTVKLYTDVSYRGSKQIQCDTIIDLNGHTFTGTNNSATFFVLNGSTLTITDSSEAKNGKLVGNNKAVAAISLGGSTTTSSNEGNKLVIEQGVTIEKNCVLVQGTNSVVDIYGKIDTSGVVDSDNYPIAAVQGNGSNTQNSIINIYEGAQIIGAEDGVAIFHPQSGTLNIEGGTITGGTGIYMRSGTLNVTGGTIEATGTQNEFNDDLGSGWMSTGDAVLLYACGYPGGAPVVEKFGGNDLKVISANGQAVVCYAKEGAEDIADKNFITGGTFSSDVTEYCETGYAAERVQDDSGSYIIKQAEYVAQVLDANGTVVGSYTTLAAAIVAAKGGQTVQLLADVTVEDAVTVAPDVTLDLNGKTLTATTGVVVGGTLTDSSNDGTGGAGLLKVDAEKFNITKENTYLPIYDTTAGGYRLYSFKFEARGITTTDNKTSVPDDATSIRMWFRLYLNNQDAYKLLTQENHGLEILIKVNKNGKELGTFNYAEILQKYAAIAEANGDPRTYSFWVQINQLDVLAAGDNLTGVPTLKYLGIELGADGSDAKLTYIRPEAASAD